MANVFTKYTIDTSQAVSALEGMKREVRELQGAEGSAQQKFQTNAQKRDAIYKEEGMSLKELRNQRDLLARKSILSTDELQKLRGYNAQIDKAEANLKSLEKQKNKVGKTNKTLAGSFQKIGLAIGAAFGIHEILRFTKQAAKLSAEAEGIRTAFERVGGTATLLENLTIATRGTVDQVQLMRQSVRASNFKIPLEQLATFFEFATTRAIETGESVDYLVNSIIDGIGRKSTLVMDNLGISATELQAEIAKVGDFGEASANIIARELGKAGDVADTTSTKIERSQAELKNAMVEMGDVVAPILADVQQGLAGLVRFLVDNKEAFGALAAAAGLYAIATKAATISTRGLTAAFKVSPWGLLAVAVIPAILAIRNVIGALKEAKTATDDFADINSSAAKAVDEQRVRINLLAKEYGGANTTLERRNDILKELRAISPKYFADLKTEETSYKDIKIAADAYLESLKEISIARAARGQIDQLSTDLVELRSELRELVGPENFEGLRQMTDDLSDVTVTADDFFALARRNAASVESALGGKGLDLAAIKSAFDIFEDILGVQVRINDISQEYRDIITQAFGGGGGGDDIVSGLRTIAQIQKDIKDKQEKMNTEVAAGSAEFFKLRGEIEALTKEMEGYLKVQATLLEQLEKLGPGIDPIADQLDMVADIISTMSTEEAAEHIKGLIAQFEGVEGMERFVEGLEKMFLALSDAPDATEGLEEFSAFIDGLDSPEQKIMALRSAIAGLGEEDAGLKEALQAQLDALLENADQQAEGLMDKYGRTAEEVAKRALDLAAQSAEALLKIGFLTQEEYDAIIDGIKEKMEEIGTTTEQTFASTLGGLSQLTGVFKEIFTTLAKDSEKNAVFLQQLTTFQILLEQASAIASAISAASKGSITVVDLAIKIATAVGAVIGAFAQAKSIQNQAQMPARPSFGYGGEIQGRPHTQGGVHIEAERGEYIVKSSAYAKAKEAVHAINAERFDTYVTQHYIEPLLKSKQQAREDNDRGFARNIAESLHLDGKAEHYLKQIARKGNGARIENWDELAHLLKKDNRGSSY